LRPGVTAAELLAKVGQIYEKRGCLKNWSWNIGHGLALTIHEPPRIAGADQTVIREGMILAIEPGLACPPHGAFAHCDGTVVTASGCERLSSAMKDLVIV
jgi:Xaa-Pro aminopeptidase